MQLIFNGLLLGIGATVLMDLWAVLLSRAGVAPVPNWALVGRWCSRVSRGHIWHNDIAEEPEVAGENLIGWLFHYAVGAIYGAAFLLLVGTDWVANPTLPVAWLFAVATIAFGWFLLQPGLGLGNAASKAPNPWKVRGLGLLAHSVFGIGLWGTALAVG